MVEQLDKVIGEDETPQPLVTVLIAAYNAAGFIDRAINSALDQSDISLELLVVDDGSDDNTKELVAQIGSYDKRVRCIELAFNQGPSAARNIGIDQARGQWIAVLDADDIFLPNRLRHLLMTARLDAADVVADNFKFYDLPTDTISRSALSEDREIEIIHAHSFVAKARPYNTEPDFGLLKPIFRKAFLEEHRLRYDPNIRHGEDFLLILNALLCGAKYVLIPWPGYLYTTRSSGRSRTRVDYKSQVAMALALCEDRAVATDRKLSNLLRIRASALNRLHVERQVETIWKERNLLLLLNQIVRDWRVMVEVARRVKRRMLR